MLELHAIGKACGTDLLPGLKQVSLIDPNDLAVKPKWYAVPSIAELQFKPGKAAFLIEHEMFSARLIDKSVESTPGQTFDYALELKAKGLNLDFEYLKAKLRNRKAHVVCVYQSGLQRLVPNMQFGLTGDSGDNSAPIGNTIVANSRLLRPAPFVDAIISVIGPPYIPPTDPGGGTGTEFEPITITTTATDYTYQLPTGKFLMAIFIKSTANQTIAIGYSPGGSELAGPVETFAGQQQKFGDNWLLASANINIYFSGLAGTNQIQICVM